MSAGVSPVPDEAVEAAWAGFKRVPAEDFRGDEDAGMRAALAAALPHLREGIAAEVLNEAADAITNNTFSMPGRVISWLRERAGNPPATRSGDGALRAQIAAEVLGPVRAILDEYSPDPRTNSAAAVCARIRAVLPAPSAPVQAAEPSAGEDGAAWFDHDEPMPAQTFEPARDACVHCGQPIDAHGGLGPWCIKAGYYGNRYTSSDAAQAAEEVGGDGE